MDSTYESAPPLTSEKHYETQGPGIGMDGGALDILRKCGYAITPEYACLEVGFSQGVLLERLYREVGCKLIVGTDIAQASLDSLRNRVPTPPRIGNDDPRLLLWKQDASKDRITFPDDTFDLASCTETIEHLTDPYFMMAEVKRTLKHGCVFIVSFPQPTRNIGYGGGLHAHIYPGFLERASWELFCKQLYFKVKYHEENGSTDWYVLRNYKGPGMVDAFAMGSGNYEEADLYACLEDF